MSKIKVGLYVRVSTAEQAKEGYSIGEQTERLRKYADAHDWTIYKTYSDPGYSGGSLDRPALKTMIQDATHKRLDKVVVYKLDRLSRSQKDTLYLIEEIFKSNGVDFVSMTENFDTGTPLGVAMIGILSVFAQLERAQITERMQVGLDARAKDGYFHGGGYDPIGYNYVNGELIVNDYEAMQVRKIFELYLDGMSKHGIAKYLNSKGYSTRFGKWAYNQVNGVLKNILYTGRITWKGETYDARHTALVDDDTFNRTQKKLDEMVTEYGKISNKKTSLLSGLLICGNCGGRYYRKKVKSRKKIKPDNPEYYYYICYSRAKCTPHMIKDPNCKNKTWREDELNGIILNEIRKLALDPEYFDHVRDDGNEERANVDIIKKRISEIDKQISKLVDLYQIGTLDFNVINSKVEKLSEEKKKLETEIDGIVEDVPELSIEETKRVLKDFNQIVDRATDAELKKIVVTLIDRIVLNEEEIEIYWRFN